MSPSADQLALPFAPDFDDLVNAAELARLFDVTPETIANWAREGKILRVELSARIIRYSRASAQAYLEACYSVAANG